MNIWGGSLYTFQESILFPDKEFRLVLLVKTSHFSGVWRNIDLSPYYLEEYGKTIIENKAVETILHFFFFFLIEKGFTAPLFVKKFIF